MKRPDVRLSTGADERMSRYSPGHSYNHHIMALRLDEYEITWVVDFYYRGSRLRFPRQFGRITDEVGARRFARKHNIPMPEERLK